MTTVNRTTFREELINSIDECKAFIIAFSLIHDVSHEVNISFSPQTVKAFRMLPVKTWLTFIEERLNLLPNEVPRHVHEIRLSLFYRSMHIIKKDVLVSTDQQLLEKFNSWSQ